MNRILVIDDEVGITDLISDALTTFGYHVETATSGRQAVQKFTEAVFDLVVTDMYMPDLDGAGVIRHIRNSCRPFTPIIGISGTPWLLKDMDCDASLSKPFSLRSLIDTVKHLQRTHPSAAHDPATFTRSFSVQQTL